MSFTSNLWARFSVWSGPRTTFRKHKRLASLVILLALLALSLGCGLIGGGAAEEMTAVLADTQGNPEADQGETADDQTGTESEGQSEPGAAAETQAETEPAAEDEPVTAAADPEPAADPVLVPDPQLPRDLTWAHLSQCVTLKPIELEATLINSDWFVTGSAEATRAYGFWKMDAITGTVTPHDTHSRRWQARLRLSAARSRCRPSFCPPDPKLRSSVTPTAPYRRFGPS